MLCCIVERNRIRRSARPEQTLRRVSLMSVGSGLKRRFDSGLRVLREKQHFDPLIRGERRELARARQQQEHLYTDPQESPLVSVIIPTWNRAKLLVERTLPSVFNQSYQNFEVIVVGDHCTDETEEMIKLLDCPSIRFCNLPERGDYPEEEWARWRVAGSKPINHAFEMARGKWIALLDDDDVFVPDQIEELLGNDQSKNLEIDYGKKKR